MRLLTESDLARYFPDVFDGSLSGNEYYGKKTHYLEIAQVQLDLNKQEIKEIFDDIENYEIGRLDYAGVSPQIAKYIKFETIQEILQALKEKYGVK